MKRFEGEGRAECDYEKCQRRNMVSYVRMKGCASSKEGKDTASTPATRLVRRCFSSSSSGMSRSSASMFPLTIEPRLVGNAVSVS